MGVEKRELVQSDWRGYHSFSRYHVRWYVGCEEEGSESLEQEGNHQR
jgi:hypothetical protein